MFEHHRNFRNGDGNRIHFDFMAGEERERPASRKAPTLEGGDVIVASRELILLGVTERTNRAGVQQLAGDATLLYYMSEESQEGKNAFLEKRKPDFRKFPRLP